MSAVIVWKKPSCGQCTAVKVKLLTAGVEFEERDLTAPDAAKDLEHFRGLGYTSAPITEYGELVVAGFHPTHLDQVIEAWRAAHTVEKTP